MHASAHMVGSPLFSAPASIRQIRLDQAKVLFLNKNYSPMKVIRAKRAFALLASGRAEVIDDLEGNMQNYSFSDWVLLSQMGDGIEGQSRSWIGTVSYPILIPQIVRTLHYSRPPKIHSRLNRINIFIRDDYTCQYCGKRTPAKKLTLDHIVPRSQGGRESWENLASCCARCNVYKGGRTPAQANMKLLRKCEKPSRKELFKMFFGSELHGSWRVFFEHQ